MKFGKQIQKQQLEIPEYGASFMDYKALKKIMKEVKDSPTLRAELTVVSGDTERQIAIQKSQAPFFFRIDRELDKVNRFYTIKEQECKVRLGVLMAKQKSMRSRTPVISKTSPSFVSLEQGFRDFIKELNKIELFMDVNGTGFAKILKKWDKATKSQTKALYLARAVEIQPCFNRDVVSEMSDQAGSSLLDCAAWAEGDTTVYQTTVTDPIDPLRTPRLESEETDSDIQDALQRGDLSLLSHLMNGSADRLTRAFLGGVSSAPEAGLRLLLDTEEINLFKQDEINDRNCLHKAAMSGRAFFLNTGLAAGVNPYRVDAYGRIPLHYACMNGHVPLINTLIAARPESVDTRDLDNFTGLIHAIVQGQLGAVEAVLAARALVDAIEMTDLIPLNLACQQGSTDIVRLLLAGGARICADAEGLYPQHLVARFGRDPKLFSMLRDYRANLDQPDKQYGWTPIFHAASEGRTDSLRVLLDCGVNPNIVDEKGHTALYYATWEGHLDCMQILYALVPGSEKKNSPSLPKTNRSASGTLTTMDIDSIPSLSLPPPIIPPTRRYGHNFLNGKTTVVLFFEEGPRNAVRLYDESKYPAARLTITPKSSDSVPRNIILPVQEDTRAVTFEMDSLDNFAVDFDLYPTFGKKVIAKGSVPADVFNDTSSNSSTHHVSFIDPLMRSVGQLFFKYQIIKPFSGTPLDVTPFATYWKATSKTERQPPSLVTGSSLCGDFVRIPVQLTWDGVPVVFPEWTLSRDSVDIPVLSLDYAKFKQIGATATLGSSKLETAVNSGNLYDLAGAVASSFTSLEDMLAMIPSEINVELHVLYPTQQEETSLRLGPTLNINRYLDNLLEVVFKHARETRAETGDRMRSMVLTSYNKALCRALNWKQPNFPVLMCNDLGAAIKEAAISNASNELSQMGRSAMSIKEAVRIARSNNFLGLICRSELLDTVPSLVDAIKNAGLVLISDAASKNNEDYAYPSVGRESSYPVDGVLRSGGVLNFSEAIDI